VPSVTTSADKTVRIWDTNTGEPVGRPLGHGSRVCAATFFAGGARIVTASADSATRIWDTNTGQPVGELLGQRAAVRAASFSADGVRIVTASEDNTAQIWNGQTGKPIGEPLSHEGAVNAAASAPTAPTSSLCRLIRRGSGRQNWQAGGRTALPQGTG
jgi:WD40 repeat protein